MRLFSSSSLSGLFIVAVVLSVCSLATSAPTTNSTKETPPALSLTDSDSDAAEQGEVKSSPDDDSSQLCSSKDSEIDCNQTEYTEYMECVEKKRSIRKKRQTLCPALEAQRVPASSPTTVTTEPELLSPCQFEYQKCVVGCQNDSACVEGCLECGADESFPLSQVSCVGDYNDCVANCPPGLPCEITCKSLCTPNVAGEVARPQGYKTVIFEGHNSGPAERVQVPIPIPHNITTIIKLNNFINNTNVITAPININNTNLNNINLFSNTTTGGQFGLGQTKDGSCCYAVRPKTCHASTTGPRCQHRRHRTCGSQCTSRVIHAQSRRTCNKRGKCRAEISYVPEPSPKCHYVKQWPYVGCGGARTQKKCDGCYDHYGWGYGDYQQRIPSRCMPCFDQGYETGPLYRQGPYYQPNFYHEPPCYMTGTCYPMGGYNYGFYAPPPPPPPPMPMPMPRPEDFYPDEEEEDFPGDGSPFPGDEEFSGHEPDEVHSEQDWENVVNKCKVINVDEDTVIIKNCTSTDLNENPYAATQVKEDYKADGGGGHKGSRRDEEWSVPESHPPMPYYPPNVYNPYGYYPQPMVPYYGAPYYAPYYPVPRAEGPRRKNDGSGRTDYYDYGTDEEEVKSSEPKESFVDMTEQELIDSGFEKVESSQ